MTARKQYDIFISYRREGGRDCARLIQQTLEKHGYNVFYDFDAIHDGVFNTQIYEAIEQSKIFILVLTEHSMDRCINENDWVRREIEYAIKQNKSIVPININNKFDGFKSELIANVAICRHINDIQYSILDTGQLYDDSINKIINNRIKPFVKPRTIINAKPIIVVAISLAVILLGAFLYIRSQATPISKEIADVFSAKIGVVDLAVSEAKDIQNSWLEYYDEVKKSKDTVNLNNNIRLKLKMHQKNIDALRDGVVKGELSGSDKFLLRFIGVNSAEADYFLQYMVDEIEYVNQLLDGLKNIMSYGGINLQQNTSIPELQLDLDMYAQTHVEMNRKFVEMTNALATTTYYCYIELLSDMPKSALYSYEKLSPSWINMPTSTSLNLPKSEYVRLQEVEIERTKRAGDEISKLLNKLDVDLREINIKIENYEGQETEVSNRINNFFDNIKQTQPTQSAQISLDRIYKSKNKVVDLKLQLIETEADLAEIYEKLLVKYSFEESDDKWMRWSKVILLGSETYRSQVYNMRKDSIYNHDVNVALKKGSDTSTIFKTPDIYPLSQKYKNLYNLIDEYILCNPEDKVYAEATRMFYKNLELTKISPNGVIIVGFKDNEVHPKYKIGDIVVERNGVKVENMEQYMQALKENSDNDPKVKVLRFNSNGDPQYSYFTLPSDITVLVGYNNIIKL